jgi:hypothetical protein
LSLRSSKPGGELISPPFYLHFIAGASTSAITERTLAAFLHGAGSTALDVFSKPPLGRPKFNSKMEERKMRKTLLLLACVLAVALGAAAQENLSFANLPLISAPSPIPNGYGGLNWNNFFYVDPYLWSGSGPGYKDGPSGQDVAFVGGKVCRVLQETCYGTITSNGGTTSFQAVSATVAGGFGPTNMTVTAYNNGSYVGSLSFPLNTGMRILNFPSSWGSITQLTFQTGAGGDLVLYDLQVYLLGG